ncbi:MAG: HAMP domain-containing histidine kinase [Acidobacteria bacterium]|nr:HAMP domain-containing histidine kinase [Acidobacteriota bacterium]
MRIGEQHYEELAGDTAHELNTYRASMEELLGELKHQIGAAKEAEPAVAEVLAKISERSRYLKALVNGLLEYSRETDAEFQVCPLRPIVTEALALAKAKTRERVGEIAVTETLAIPDELKLEVLRPRVVQALSNILSNALEALQEKPPTTFLEITAETNGIDRDPSQVENAKKRFRSLKKERGGIGLGLPLALKIIEREHSGRLNIESELGAGTVVTVELPVRKEAKR